MLFLPKPVRNLTGWAKATAISAIALLISLGLCGLNLGAFSVLHLPMGGGSVPGQESQERLGGLLVMTAFAEAVAIVLFSAALLVCLVGLLITFLVKRGPER